MRRPLRIVVPLLAIGGLITALPLLFPKKPLEVMVFRAAYGDVRETVSSPSAGTVTSEREARVAAEAVGRVVAVKLREGDRAGLGEPVVILDARDAELDLKAARAAQDRQAATLEQARVKLRKAQEDADRAQTSRSILSDEQLKAFVSARDLAKAEVDWAERALGEAQVAVERAAVALSKRSIRAPFTGVIRARHVEVGELVVIGTPCFEIYDDERTYVKAPIDEVDLPRIDIGKDVEVTLESFPDRIFHGRVRDIEPAVRTTVDLNRTGEVEVELLDAPQPEKDGSYPPGLAPIRVGMSADIEVIARVHHRVLKVPALSVHEDAKGKFVYLVAGGKIARRPVKIGASNWDYAEVQDGLAEGVEVVASVDVEGLADGAPARVTGEVEKVAPQ
jgi:HlyD family secretion protein